MRDEPDEERQLVRFHRPARLSRDFSTDVECSDTFRTFQQCPCIRLGILESTPID
jgi:hypothetical protein